MKKDVVEIFQTIRASLQPYAALGFGATENSETAYQLYTEKRLDETAEDAIYFGGVEIKGPVVEFCLFPKDSTEFSPAFSKLKNSNGCFQVTELGEEDVAEIEIALSEGYRIYKEKAWV